jgi:hypothetical protein
MAVDGLCSNADVFVTQSRPLGLLVHDAHFAANCADLIVHTKNVAAPCNELINRLSEADQCLLPFVHNNLWMLALSKVRPSGALKQAGPHRLSLLLHEAHAQSVVPTFRGSLSCKFSVPAIGAQPDSVQKRGSN